MKIIKNENEIKEIKKNNNNNKNENEIKEIKKNNNNNKNGILYWKTLSKINLFQNKRRFNTENNKKNED